MVSPVLEISPGHHVGFLPGVDGDVGGNALLVQQVSQSASIVAGVGSQGEGLNGQLPEDVGHRFPLTLRGMGDATGEDEPAPIYDGVVLVIQFRRLIGPTGAPASVGVHRA